MKKRVLSALLALCLTLSLAGAAFAENETLSPAQETSVPESASSAAEPASEEASEPEEESEGITSSSSSASSESQPATKAESTPVPTAAAAASNVTEKETESATSKDEVEISTAETAQEPSYPAQDFEAAVDGADMAVNVSAPEGALPEDVTLTASLVGSSEDNADDQAVADVAAELDDADVEYDGFVALDISFVDADGNKVEPLQPVSVNFTLPAELLPEDVDPSTLEVQHLKENEAGEVIAVEPVADVADATEGTVTVEADPVALSAKDVATMPQKGEISAEFTVDGFSRFTLIYDLTGGWGEIVGDAKLTVICVDENGNEINADPDLKLEDITIGSGDVGAGTSQQITVEEIIARNDIETITATDGKVYEFSQAQVYTTGKSIFSGDWVDTAPADAFRYRNEDGIGAIGNGWQYREPEDENEDWSTMPILAEIFGLQSNTVFLVYTTEEEEVEHPEVTVPDHSKTVTANKTSTGENDGTFTLKLDVTGDYSSITDKLKMNLLLVIDQSKSMDDPIGGGKSKMDAVETAVEALTNALEQNSDNVDVMYNVVAFSDLAGTSSITGGWTDNTSTVNEAVQSIDPNEGTNYQAAFREAKEQLRVVTGGATCVIFLTDGDPTYRLWGNGEAGTGSNDSWGLNIDAAVSEISTMAVDSFYCVGTGQEGKDFNRDNLERLCEAVAATETACYSASNADELTKTFTDIAGATTTLATDHITVSDTLSEWVVPVTGAKPCVTVTDENGQEVGSGNGTSSVEIGNNTTISAELKENELTLNFPETYALREDWTYSVTLKIQPSQVAIDDYQTNNKYPHTADEDTGDYAGGMGYYSNTSATLTYKGVEDPEEQDPAVVEYKMPVIQIDDRFLTPPTADLTITKRVDDSIPETVDLDKEKYTFTVTGPATLVGAKDITYGEQAELLTFVAGTHENTDKAVATVTVEGESSVTIYGLPTKQNYIVTEGAVEDIDTETDDGKLDYYPVPDETKYQIDNSEASTTPAAITNLIQNTTVTVTNTYKPYKSLTITKEVIGEMGSYEDWFNFDSGNSSVKVKTNSDTNKAEIGSGSTDYDFRLKNDGKVEIVNLKENDSVTITEAESTTGYTPKGASVESTVLTPYSEENPNGYTTTSDNRSITITVPSSDGTDLGTVTFTNERKAVAPTGLEDNHTKPFGLMVGVAVMAGLALVGGAVVRRRRRWME